MQPKKFKIREVFRSSNQEEADKYLKDTIVKIMLRQQQKEAKAI